MYHHNNAELALEYPLVVKSIAEASSYGVQLVHTIDEMRDAVRNNLTTFSQSVLVEQFIPGRELNVSIHW